MSEYFFVHNGTVYKTKKKKQFNKTNSRPKQKRGRKPTLKTLVSREFVGLKDNELKDIYEIIIKYKNEHEIELYDNLDLNQLFEEKNKNKDIKCI